MVIGRNPSGLLWTGGAQGRDLGGLLGVEGAEDFFSKESNEERAAEAREKAAEVIRLLEEAGK